MDAKVSPSRASLMGLSSSMAFCQPEVREMDPEWTWMDASIRVHPCPLDRPSHKLAGRGPHKRSRQAGVKYLATHPLAVYEKAPVSGGFQDQSGNRLLLEVEVQSDHGTAYAGVNAEVAGLVTGVGVVRGDGAVRNIPALSRR